MHRLRKATRRQQQNESLTIARRNLFDSEASSSINYELKITPPIKSLRGKNSKKAASSINTSAECQFHPKEGTKAETGKLYLTIVKANNNEYWKYPIGVYENLLVKIENFIFPVDFVVLKMDVDEIGNLRESPPLVTIICIALIIPPTCRFVLPRNKPIVLLEWKALENRLKPSIKEPSKVELKELLDHLEYAFLQEDDQLPVVISSSLFAQEKTKLLKVLKNYKGAIAWSIPDIKGIDSSFYTHKILMEDEFKPIVQPQRHVNLNIKEVVKKEVIKLPDAGLINPISNSH
ncbi:hypothetical protein Tco_1568629 [Tanacetum coccineum]